jgi:hypothetical protein
MGKPVRKTIKPGLLPSAVAWRPKTGLKVREIALGLGAHTATPNTKTVWPIYSAERLRKCFEKANEV